MVETKKGLTIRPRLVQFYFEGINIGTYLCITWYKEKKTLFCSSRLLNAFGILQSLVLRKKVYLVLPWTHALSGVLQ